MYPFHVDQAFLTSQKDLTRKQGDSTHSNCNMSDTKSEQGNFLKNKLCQADEALKDLLLFFELSA